MSPKTWLNQGSPRVVCAALAIAVVAGLGAGAWLKLPGYLAEPIHTPTPQMILADDPGRERWSQVVASLGGLGATFVVPAAFYSDRSPEPEFAPDLEEAMAAATAQIDLQLREAEQRAQAMRVAWLEAPPRRYGYEPVRYGDPSTDAAPVYGQGYPPQTQWAPSTEETVGAEQATTAPDEPLPPPPPRPSEAW